MKVMSLSKKNISQRFKIFFYVLLPFFIMIMHYNAEKCFCIGFAEFVSRVSSFAFQKNGKS